MKIHLIVILTVFLAFLFMGCEKETPLTQSVPDQELQMEDTESAGLWWGWEEANIELEKKFTSTIANKDLDGFMSCLWNSPDFILVLENGWVVRGWDNARAGLAQMFEAHESLSLVIDEISRFRVGRNVYAVGKATWTRTLKPAYGGGTTSFQEVWTDVRQWQWRSGKWVVMVNHPHDLTPFPPQPQ